MQRRRILLAASLAALIVSFVSMTSRHSLAARSASPAVSSRPPAQSAATYNAGLAMTTPAPTATPATCGTAAYDAVTDFSASANPNNTWSYGWVANLGGSFNLYTGERTVYQGLDTWEGPEGMFEFNFPAVSRNHTGTTLNYAVGISQPANMLGLSPSYSDKFSVVRWTAPTTGAFSVTGLFQGIDTRNTTTDVHIRQNSAIALFDGNINGFGDQAPFNLVVNLAAGDTLDFAVGFGANGTFYNDQTGLAVMICAGGPMPTPTPTPTPTPCPSVANIADGDVAGLIAAINSANASGCPTTINLAPNGTYTLTDVADDGSGFYCCGPSGLPYVQSQLTINGNGATIQRSSAAGTPPFGIIRVAHYPSNPPSTTSNLTLDGVTLTGATGPVVGVWQSTALVRNTTITNNPGQGILTFGSNLTVLNSTISYNTGSSCVGPICGYGGGGILHFESPSTVISYSTIFENQSGGVGDAIATAFSDPGSVVVKNSILASPTRGRGLLCWVNGGDAILSLGHNIAGDSTCGPGSNAAPGGFTGPGDMNNTNPLLGPLANNGGPTPTHMPLCNSPAIDRVPFADSTDVNAVPVTTDQRGINRPQGTASDIGAVEVVHGQTVTLSVTAPNDSSAFADANCQAAIPNYVSGTTVSGGSGNVTLSQSPAAGTLVGLGPHTVTVTAMDGCGNGSDTVVFTVTDNTPPSFTSSPPNLTVNTDPGACSAVVTFTLPSATDNCSTLTVTSSPASGSTFPKGTTNVTVTATDAAGNSTSRTFTVAVADHENPIISCPANVNLVDNSAGSCGASFNPTAPAASDNCGIPSVVGTRSDGHALTDLYPVGPTTINWVAKDSSGNTASCSQTITVGNPAPSVSLTSPASGALYVVNSAIAFNATFADNAGDSHTAVWSFDGLPQAGVVNESAHTISASHTFTAAGVYAVTLTVVDDCGQTATTNQVGGFDAFVVIYDPNAGFVTGGGWIDSPLGAYTPNPLLTGKANFGFVSKYQPGANVPDGQTEFQFKAGNLNFHSTSYDWLVVAGARAQYKGSGTINGAGNYAFMLTAIDGQINGGGGVDKFRIKIWDRDNGGIIYDNQLNAPDSADPSTALGGGSIVIHK